MAHRRSLLIGAITFVLTLGGLCALWWLAEACDVVPLWARLSP